MDRRSPSGRISSSRCRGSRRPCAVVDFRHSGKRASGDWSADRESRFTSAESGRSRGIPHCGSWKRQERPEATEADAAFDRIEAVALPTDVEPWSLLAGLTFGYWIREDVALTLGFSALESSVSNITGPDAVDNAPQHRGYKLEVSHARRESLLQCAGTSSISAGARRGRNRDVHGHSRGQDCRGKRAHLEGGRRDLTAGSLGRASYVQLNRHFMLGARGGYNIMADFDKALGGPQQLRRPRVQLECELATWGRDHRSLNGLPDDICTAVGVE